jgi:hypothetical protein
MDMNLLAELNIEQFGLDYQLLSIEMAVET